MAGQLLRPRYDRKIAGVCGAFARAYGWDTTVVRLVLVALVLFGGGGLLAYVICWVVIPEEPVVMPPTAPVTSQGYPPSAASPYTQEPPYTAGPEVPPSA